MPVPIWPDRFIQFRDRMKASERMARFNWSKRTAPTTQQDVQADHINTKEPETTAEDTPNTTYPRADPDLESTHLGLSPAFGILGIPHYGDGDGAESETPSQRHTWRDYDDDGDDDDDAFHGDWCSKDRWRHVFCTRQGLTNTGKRLVTTTLGLVVILALALTALGKIRHHNRVSDVIPESLEGKVYEAQVVIIEDFHGKMSSLEKREQGQGQGQGRKGTKVPFWERPLGAGCLQQQCETEAWKEFIAFMNPESFGIQLPQNWPSLCSSCIEISRNEFVYRTTVRVLGDLSQCAPTTTSPPAPSSPSPPSVPPTLPQTSSSKIQISSKTVRITSPSKKPVPQHHEHGTHTPKKTTISKNTSNPRSRTPSRKATLSKRQVKSPTQGETFPSLIVDPATFNNLTEYNSVNAIQSMEQLCVQFRFVLCDD